MALYKRKPTLVEAIRWNGEPHPLIDETSCEHPGYNPYMPEGWVATPFSSDMICVGDWLVTFDDEAWVYTDEEFHKTFEPLED